MTPDGSATNEELTDDLAPEAGDDVDAMLMDDPGELPVTAPFAAPPPAPPAPPAPAVPTIDALQAAAEANDEDRFVSLVEAVLHEADETAVRLLAPYVSRPGAIGRVAAHGLLMLGMPALDALLDALATGPASAQLHAAWALGSIKDPRATAALLQALDLPERTPELAQACLDSLAELGDRSAVPTLLAKLREPDFTDLRPAVCRALGHIGDPSAVQRIMPLLGNPKPTVRLRAAEALIRLLDKRGWPVLFALLRGEDVRGESTVAALRGLGELSGALAPFLGDDDYHTRRDAAEVLGSFGDTRAVGPLIEAMQDINPWVRGAATYSVGRLGDRKGFKFLIMALKDESAWVRQSAVRALGLLGDARARRPLEEMLFDQDPEISAAAQEALNALSDR